MKGKAMATINSSPSPKSDLPLFGSMKYMWQILNFFTFLDRVLLEIGIQGFNLNQFSNKPSVTLTYCKICINISL
jgi:hypothetical protein